MAIVKFNAAIDSMSGKSGGGNYARTPYGTEFKNNPAFHKPATPAQIAQRARVTKAGAAFRALTAAQNAEWQAYAYTRFVKSTNGAMVHPSAYAAYVGLYTKYLQVNPTGAALADPPAASFGGDSITLTMTGISGSIQFTASAKNTVGVTTEFLLQPLANLYRKPQSGAYVSHGFFAFPTTPLTRSVAVTPGVYAVAYRFVNAATGQEVAKAFLGVINVSL